MKCNYSFRKYIGIPDFILIMLLIILPVLMLYFNVVSACAGDAPYLTVYVHGELYGTYDLDTPQTIAIGDTNTLRISDGTASMIHADCPDQVCVHSAPIGKDFPGHIVCLPNSVVVSIEHADNSLNIDGYVS